MTIFGYWRCSTNQQDQERQILALKEAGCEKIYGDKITGVSNYGDREELSKLLEEIGESDLLITSELSRIGRSMVMMLVEVNNLLEKGVELRTLDNRLDTTTMPKEIVRLIVSVMGYAAEQELAAIKSRTAEGREVAKNRGVVFGRKKTYNEFQAAKVLEEHSEGKGYSTIAKSLGMSKSMVQRIIKREKVAA
tara:strand:+ start:64 stop:642 length:579 start_codon:yes stop_codon:yes gene_type:complete